MSNEQTAENDSATIEHPIVVTVRDYLNNAGITADVLRYAATHEALCRSWIFDLLTGLADTLDAQRATPPDVTEETA